MKPEEFLGVLGAVTGLTLEDVMEQTLAETPEEQTQAMVKTLRKTQSHMRGVPLEDVPDFINYPETGRPPNEDKR